jgi:hypothetical protein
MPARANAGSGEKTIKAQDRGYKVTWLKGSPTLLVTFVTF